MDKITAFLLYVVFGLPSTIVDIVIWLLLSPSSVIEKAILIGILAVVDFFIIILTFIFAVLFT